MRIACIHIPQFALQSATRVDPALRGAPVAVVSSISPGAPGRELAGVLHAPIVLACSRSAWAHGVRLGMTATAARSQSAEIQIVTADAATERESVRAIADALLGIASVVDVGGRVGAGGAHLAMYAAVPAKTRGAAFGERLIELLDELGLTARIGIADDRFTAWVAAAHGGGEDGGVIAVPRGGSAAFLAPRPLSLLAISPEVQHMLEALGVRTLGEFAALPAPSIARPLSTDTGDYRALARGESDATLRPYTPEAPIREEVTVSAGNVLELQDLLPAGEQAKGLSLGAAIALVARRLELRLTGRGRGAARLEVTALGALGALDAIDGTREFPITLEHGFADAESLAHVIATALESVSSEHAGAHDQWRLRVVVAAELVVGSETTEIFAEGSQRYTSTSIYAVAVEDSGTSEQAAASVFSASEARSAHAHARPGESRRRSTDHPGAETIDALAVVLSSSGSLFALSPPTLQAERRDAHRRTRRGKERRSRRAPAMAAMQPRLFDRTSSK